MAELPHQSNGRAVLHGHWTNDRVRAQCQACDWSKSAISQGAVVAATSRHVKATGHPVWLERVQGRMAIAREPQHG